MSRRLLRIGFVPEHFSTPLAFAHRKYGLQADLIPFPTGTGALTNALKTDKLDEGIDVAIGLTEGFVADLGKTTAASQQPSYSLVGTYVTSPLRWAISAGAEDKGLQVKDLLGKRVGVSRIGSGSYVMSYVLADQQGWLKDTKQPFEVKTIGDFAALRKAVNGQEADFFMWEHFTTKHYWDNGEIRRIGEIYTPWPSWMIAARKTIDAAGIQDLSDRLNQGVKHYKDDKEAAIKHITTAMHYSREDTEAWMETVEFPDDVHGVDAQIVDGTVAILKKAGVLDQQSASGPDMISVSRR